MNILFFLRKNIVKGDVHGGAETSSILIAQKLEELGHNVTFVTLNQTFTIRQLSTYIEEEGIRFTIINQFRCKRLFKVVNKIIFKYELKRIVNAKNIELVYCHYDLRFLETLLKIKNDESFPKIVMRMAGMKWYEESKASKNKKEQYEKVFNKLDSINYLSEGLHNLVNKKFEELNMTVNIKGEFIGDIGSTFNVKKNLYKNNKSEIHDGARFKLVMASRFSNYQKRYDIFLQSIKVLKNEIPIEVALIGEGPTKEDAQSYINDNELNDIVSILPFLSQTELWDKISKSDLICLCTDYEGVSKIILESMSLGLPVLASDVLPINDYVINNYNGFLVENDPKKWADKIISLYQNKHLREQVSVNSKKFIKQKYNPDKNISLYEKNFEKIVSGE